MSLPRKHVDWKSYDTHHADGRSDAEFARRIGMDPRNFHQYKKSRHLDEPPGPGAEDTALHSAHHSADLPAVQSSAELPTVQTSAPDSAETLADHETRLQVLESFVKVLQEQAQHLPVPQITVQRSADSAYALPSAEQSWDDPEDAKPERWNLWLPRGLKRRIETTAKAAGIAPSQLVQRLLLASLNGGEQ
jgi:hypothetical protein